MVKYAIRLWAGVCLGPRSLKTKQSAISNQQSAKAPCGFHALRPSADWDWVWVAPGWPLGGPSVAQGPPKRGAREAQASIECKSALFATKDEKRPGGGEEIAGIADIARHPTPEAKSRLPGTPVIAEIGKAKPHHRSTQMTLIGGDIPGVESCKSFGILDRL